MKWRVHYEYMATGMDSPDIRHQVVITDAATKAEAIEKWLDLFSDDSSESYAKDREWMRGCCYGDFLVLEFMARHVIHFKHRERVHV